MLSFKNKILFVGYGAVAECTLPILFKHLKVPADLWKLPIIRDTSTMLSWEVWATSAGFDTLPESSGPTFDDPALAFDAAISEQAIEPARPARRPSRERG